MIYRLIGALLGFGVASAVSTKKYARGGKVIESEAFKKWFGDSKVVDADGKPLVVYHGTPSDLFDEFSTRYAGKNRVYYGGAIFFTDNFDTAYFYTQQQSTLHKDVRPTKIAEAQELVNEYWEDIAKKYLKGKGKTPLDHKKAQAELKALQPLRRGSSFSECITHPNSGNVFEVYLKIENPLVIDADGSSHRDILDGGVIDDAKEKGHDGIIVENIMDYPCTFMEQKPMNDYIVFSPTQIKLADGRNTTFDSNSPKITMAKGGEVSFYEGIREELIKGENFENESADWYTLNNPKNNVRMIVIRGENKFYKNIDSYAKRVVQLLKRGY